MWSSWRAENQQETDHGVGTRAPERCMLGQLGGTPRASLADPGKDSLCTGVGSSYQLGSEAILLNLEGEAHQLCSQGRSSILLYGRMFLTPGPALDSLWYMSGVERVRRTRRETESPGSACGGNSSGP